MYQTIQLRCQALANNFKEIPPERVALLDKLAQHISQKLQEGKPVNLIYVCTHNSRRSHLGQVWAKTAAKFYGFDVNTFSAGTEVTAFNPNAINALANAGFVIEKYKEGDNPHYKVFLGDGMYSECFSKTTIDDSLPKQNFIAVMTCGHADENCPFIPGTDLRIATTYNDPKAYDNTVLQDEKYTERSNQIAMECLYLFSKVKTKN